MQSHCVSVHWNTPSSSIAFLCSMMNVYIFRLRAQYIYAHAMRAHAWTEDDNVDDGVSVESCGSRCSVRMARVHKRILLHAERASAQAS